MQTVRFIYPEGAYSIMLKFWVPCSVESIISVKPVKAGEQHMSGPLCFGEGTPYVCSLSVPVFRLRQANRNAIPPAPEGRNSSKAGIVPLGGMRLVVPGTMHRIDGLPPDRMPMKMSLGFGDNPILLV
jgi:hypothetical protein